MPEDRIERWMMEEVKRFMEKAFLDSTVDYFPRGSSAVLFRAEGRQANTNQRKLLHQLWVDKAFFLRSPDRTSLRMALEGTDVTTSMKKAGDKIVELR